MACLAGKLLSDPRFENPTLVMVTDRQDLDGQLFGVFARVGDLLPENPQQAETREDLPGVAGQPSQVAASSSPRFRNSPPTPTRAGSPP